MQNQTGYLLRADAVSRRFGHEHVLQSVSLHIYPREIITLIGPNGSGKTTLLKLLLGLDTPDSGMVYKKPDLRIGFVPQKIQLNPTMPMNVRWYLAMHRSPGNDYLSVCEELAIHDLLGLPMHSLSGGEMQRVMLARALLGNPELLVLDEPVQGVDVTGQAELYQLIHSVSVARGAAVLMVSHDLHLVMASSTRVICLNHHVCCEGKPHEIQSDPAFSALFGARVAENMALYVHHHDHVHDARACVNEGHHHGE